MDNLAHTLVGACLAETGLRRLTPLATATLVIGANLPDVDGLTLVWGTDASLYWRRGHTHGLVAMALLPPLLAGAMLAWDRGVRRRRSPGAPPARFGPLLALSALGVLSHPALDWLNTYGVRLLMPFEERWFYGDTLFIIDPWLWLLAAAAVVLARSRTRLSAAGWGVAAAATTALVTGVPTVPAALKGAWALGVGGVLLARLWLGPREEVPAAARGLLGVLALYILAMLGGSRLAQAQVEDWLRAKGIPFERTVAGPLPAHPFVRDVIVLAPGRYLFVKVDWTGAERFAFSDPAQPREAPGPVVQAALASSEVRGFRHWMRFPSWQVEETPTGFRVVLRDVRYSRLREGGIGTRVVELDRQLRPRSPAAASAAASDGP